MPENMIIYKQITFNSCGIHEEVRSIFFEESQDARDFINDAWNLCNTIVDIQRYDYTGCEYVLLERKHRDL